MENGVTVLAASPGTIRATRDGMPDIASNAPNAPDITNQDCGNAVVITHAGGWETQYCHLKRGSVVVTRGQTVSAGTPVGQIGLSGNTEFPHLHLSLRQNGEVIDPFSPGPTTSCNTPDPGLWSPPLPYQPGGLIGAGFAADVPSFGANKAGTASNSALPRTAPTLVIWAHIFGPRAGDTLTRSRNSCPVSGTRSDMTCNSSDQLDLSRAISGKPCSGQVRTADSVQIQRPRRNLESPKMSSSSARHAGQKTVLGRAMNSADTRDPRRS
jgi:hypothetical protein